MRSCKVIIFLSVIILISVRSFGQNIPDTTKVFRIETKDGNAFTGNITRIDSISLVFKTDKFGEIKIPLNEIKSRTEIKDFKVVNNALWLSNPQASRYFWAPNGYGLEKGSSYYQNIWVLYNQVSISASDNFSVGLGMIPLFLFAGAPSPLWLLPKISIPVVKDKLNIGAGALLGAVLAEGSGAFGLLYETTTFGSRDRNLSIGFTYGFAGDSWMNRPIINVSTMIRTGPKGYFISENYIIPYKSETWDYDRPVEKYKSAVIISLGGRSIIRNIGLDYSLWIPVGANLDSFVAIPFLGVTIPIGKKN
ncbi:MAG TPA: hypothetical protein VJ963_14680 [Bacteroidales bacterium]|nr:hypothetical protein [Bacteroidales bacterium]